MLGKEVVSKAMKLRGMSTPVLAEKLGYATTSGVSQRLYCKQDMRVDTLAKFLKELDCKIIVKSNLSDKTVWVIDGVAEDGEDEEK
jgi:hypothetical protein